jgi:hypothetical protein
MKYYAQKGLALVYCAHRDESTEKLDVIGLLDNLNIIILELLAELFILVLHENVSEIAVAYSSVINNLSLMFPDKPIASFRLNSEAINPKNRNNIDGIYRYFSAQGIFVEDVF